MYTETVLLKDFIMKGRAFLTAMAMMISVITTGTSAVAGNYIARDHLVVDLRFGVEWLRCSVGQIWNGTTCVGEIILLNHEEIEQAITQANEQLGEGWRLPTLEELEALICEDCTQPMIDAEYFPATAGEPYWTGEVNGMATRHYFSVNFFNGWTYGRYFPTQPLAVRFVRDRHRSK
jgi:hypothetical protein